MCSKLLLCFWVLENLSLLHVLAELKSSLIGKLIVLENLHQTASLFHNSKEQVETHYQTCVNVLKFIVQKSFVGLVLFA